MFCHARELIENPSSFHSKNLTFLQNLRERQRKTEKDSLLFWFIFSDLILYCEYTKFSLNTLFCLCCSFNDLGPHLALHVSWCYHLLLQKTFQGKFHLHFMSKPGSYIYRRMVYLKSFSAKSMKNIHYRLGTCNLNTVNPKFHLNQSFFISLLFHV